MYSYRDGQGRTLSCIEDEDLSKLFLPRPSRINKGSCGMVVSVCGSYDESFLSMSGAAYFASAAAYRTGVGIVHLYSPRENFAPLSVKLPEAVFTVYDAKAPDLELLAEAVDSAEAVIVGCGLGRSDTSREIVRTVLENASGPLVIDADALNILAASPDMWSLLSSPESTVITPHPGEMSRLCGLGISDILEDTVGTAVEVANEYGVVCVLKDSRTVITDGASVFINDSGNPGMATAGSGDVLSGIIGGLIVDRRDLLGAELLYKTAAAVYLHGRAGDHAAERLGEYSMMASDIIDSIGEVITLSVTL